MTPIARNLRFIQALFFRSNIPNTQQFFIEVSFQHLFSRTQKKLVPVGNINLVEIKFQS